MPGRGYACSPELFDTRSRSLGTGISYSLGRLANAAGPMIVAALYQSNGLPQRLLLHRRLARRRSRPGCLRLPHPPGPRGRAAEAGGEGTSGDQGGHGDGADPLWDVDTEDWKYPDASRVAQYVISHAGRNEVVLLHDILPTSVGAVPAILKALTAQDYHFVTVSHLRATL